MVYIVVYISEEESIQQDVAIWPEIFYHHQRI